MNIQGILFITLSFVIIGCENHESHGITAEQQAASKSFRESRYVPGEPVESIEKKESQSVGWSVYGKHDPANDSNTTKTDSAEKNEGSENKSLGVKKESQSVGWSVYGKHGPANKNVSSE